MYRVYRYNERKASLLLGNYNNFRYALPFVKNDKLPSFFTEKILKSDATLSTCTTLTAKKIELVNGAIKTTNAGLVVYESETTISSPSTYILLGSNTLYNWFYSDVSQTFTSLADGLYVFAFSDGTNEFETDIFCIDNDTGVSYLLSQDSNFILLEDGNNITLQ